MENIKPCAEVTLEIAAVLWYNGGNDISPLERMIT